MKITSNHSFLLYEINIDSFQSRFLKLFYLDFSHPCLFAGQNTLPDRIQGDRYFVDHNYIFVGVQ